MSIEAFEAVAGPNLQDLNFWMSREVTVRTEQKAKVWLHEFG
jgi:hypothetical protein